MRGDWHIVEELLISSTAFPIRGDSSTSVENDRPDSTYHVALLSPSFLPSFPPFLPFPTSLPRPRDASVSYFHSPGEFHFSSYLRRRAWMKRAIDFFFSPPLPSSPSFDRAFDESRTGGRRKLYIAVWKRRYLLDHRTCFTFNDRTVRLIN